jgi:hypothetical protein
MIKDLKHQDQIIHLNLFGSNQDLNSKQDPISKIRITEIQSGHHESTKWQKHEIKSLE